MPDGRLLFFLQPNGDHIPLVFVSAEGGASEDFSKWWDHFARHHNIPGWKNG